MKSELVHRYSMTLPKMDSESDVAVIRYYDALLSYRWWDVFKMFPTTKIVRERVRYVRILDEK